MLLAGGLDLVGFHGGGVLGGEQHGGLVDVEVVKPIIDVGLGDVQSGGEGAGGPQVGDLGAVGHLCW